MEFVLVDYDGDLGGDDIVSAAAAETSTEIERKATEDNEAHCLPFTQTLANSSYLIPAVSSNEISE